MYYGPLEIINALLILLTTRDGPYIRGARNIHSNAMRRYRCNMIGCYMFGFRLAVPNRKLTTPTLTATTTRSSYLHVLRGIVHTKVEISSLLPKFDIHSSLLLLCNVSFARIQSVPAFDCQASDQVLLFLAATLL